jgi:hypothetical protein
VRRRGGKKEVLVYLSEQIEGDGIVWMGAGAFVVGGKVVFRVGEWWATQSCLGVCMYANVGRVGWGGWVGGERLGRLICGGCGHILTCFLDVLGSRRGSCRPP